MDSDDAVSIAAAFNLRDGDGGGGTSGHSRYQRGDTSGVRSRRRSVAF